MKFFLVLVNTIFVLNFHLAAQTQINTILTSSQDSLIAQKKLKWTKTINSFWGPGLPVEEKLQIFDNMWNDVDQNFGAFINLEVNIDSLRALYRPEIEAGVSKGRFVAIMNYFGLALKDLHTQLVNVPVNWGTSLNKGTPLFVAGAWRENRRFGAVLTPLANGSLLVIKVQSFQRLSLKPGDIILGYEGIPWKIWYREIMDVQMPIFWRITGSTDESFEHMMLQSAGLNWHLFDTIDVLKYESGDTVHLSTSVLINPTTSIWGTEQLKIPGVPSPDFINEDLITWGIIEGTKIGYIYVSSWNNTRPELEIRQKFLEAVDDLMHNHETSGLIIDSRFNTGGSMAPALDGYSLLFNTENEGFGAFDIRGNPNDHFDMIPHPTLPHSVFIIKPDPNTYYDKPIALLIGPNSVSAGDNESLRMTFHPMVRTFGLPTNGAFTLSDFPDLGNSEWSFQKATGSSFTHFDHKYFAHTAVVPDERIWFKADDVANGDDSVVEAAKSWMNNLVHAHDTKISYKQDSIVIRTKVENPNNVSMNTIAIVHSSDSTIVDTIFLNKDSGIDGSWTTSYKPAENKKLSYLVDIITTNLVENSKWILPNATRFTTEGPIVLSGISFSAFDSIPNPGDNFRLRINLKNESLSSTVSNITGNLSSKDSCISSFTTNNIAFGNLDMQADKTRSFNIKISENCNGHEQIKLLLRIASEGYYYWQDSIFIHLQPTDLDNDLVEKPTKFELYQNYPNPFNPSTSITYSLPKRSHVTLEIYNIVGQKVRTLMKKKEHSTGIHSILWNGTDDSGKQVSSGVYIYRIQSKEIMQSHKMIIIR